MTLTKVCAREDLMASWSARGMAWVCRKCHRCYQHDYSPFPPVPRPTRDEWLKQRREAYAAWAQLGLSVADVEAITAPYQAPCGSFQ